MVNLRKTNYVGSQPVASKLLFASAPQGSAEYVGEEVVDLSVMTGPSEFHRLPDVDEVSETRSEDQIA